MVVVSTALLVGLVSTGATTRIDNAVYDLSLRLNQHPPRRDIVIVAIDPASLEQLGQWPWPRRAEADLINAIARDGPRGLACYFLFLFHSTPADDQAVHDAMIRARTFVPLPRRPATGGRDGSVMRPIPQIASAVAGMGWGDQKADEDGIVRRTSLFEGVGGKSIARVVVQMARMDGRGTRVAGTASRSADILIPYAGPTGAFATVSAIAVLEGRIPRHFFHDKFVLVGATAPDLLDNYPTPTSPAMSNVEVDANLLDSLLSGGAIVPASRATTLVVSLGLLWLLLIALVRLPPRDNLWLAAAMSALPLAASVFGVWMLAVWLPPTPYLATLAIIIPYWGWRRLQAASAYFAGELRALERHLGGAVLAESRSTAMVGGDVVHQQMSLLEEAKRRISDLRRFVADILANFPDPVLVVDREGNVLTVNQAASEFGRRIGVSAAPGAPVQAILSKITPFDSTAPRMWPPPPEPAAARGSSALSSPLTGEDPHGRAYELRLTPTRSADDEATGWIVHLADITLRIAALRERETAMVHREEALQLLSHDMRAPQAAILAILDHPDFQTTPADMRLRIGRQARHTLNLADTFVRLANAESADYAFEPIDLGRLLEEAVDTVWSLAEAGGVRLTLEPRAVEYVVLADRGLIVRALVNLLDNAVKFSRTGKHVTCRLAFATLDGRAAVACQIADSAGGMEQAELTRLFSRFANSRPSVDGARGVGLGLALVHTVATRHRGTIVCESAAGLGTVFTVTLPLCEEVEARALANA